MGNSVPQEISRRITSLRFLLIAFVVFIHANLTADDALNYYHLDFVQPAWIEWFKGFVCGTLAGAAVPLFFLFSSYLQFSKYDAYSVLLKKRSRTLLLPYIVWTIITIALFAAAQAIPQTAPFFQNEINIVKNWNAFDCLKAFTYHNLAESLKTPLVYQFWFLRDLMIFIVLSPILRFLCRTAPYAMIAALSAVYVCGIPVFITVSSGALFFYAAGYFFAEKKISFFTLADKIRLREYAVLTAFLEIMRVFAKIDVGVAQIVVSCLFFLKLSRFIVSRPRLFSLAERLAGFSFFVYAVHTPFLGTAINKLCWKVIPLHGALCLVQFLAAAFLTLALSLLFATALKKLCAPLFSVLNGGRK
ncbi:MAG: acyltransferase [Bacteroides sp.]|nr:acyltransferase [Prevotella sp.]MCM1407211.1 acyltransferase [Treponema brennaborense]MCM1470363.1 acyltransferase [Bacteroides sp.]